MNRWETLKEALWDALELQKHKNCKSVGGSALVVPLVCASISVCHPAWLLACLPVWASISVLTSRPNASERTSVPKSDAACTASNRSPECSATSHSRSCANTTRDSIHKTPKKRKHILHKITRQLWCAKCANNQSTRARPNVTILKLR